MKRLGVATACSFLLHAGLFWIGSGWFLSRTVPPSVSRFVTVTMSYRETQEQAAGAYSAEAGPRDMPAPGNPVNRPAKEKSAKARSAQPSKQESVSISEHGNVRDAGEENASDAAGQQGAAQGAGGGSGMGGGGGGGSGMNGSGMGMVRAAVPLYKVNPPPPYPVAARRKGQQGMVVLSVHVDAQGRVSNLWLFKSSEYRSLDNAAIAAVKDWLFEPAMQGGKNVAMWVNVPVRFELK